MNELPINISSIIDKLPDFQHKLSSITNNIYINILHNIINEIYEIHQQKYKKNKFHKLSDLIMILENNGLLNKDNYKIFKDYIIKQITPDNKFDDSDKEVIDYIFYFTEEQINKINSNDSDKLYEIDNDNKKEFDETDDFEEDFEDDKTDDYEEDFDDDEINEEIDEIPQKKEDTSTKINDVLLFLKDLCSILAGFIVKNNINLQNLRQNINKLNNLIINTIKNTKSNSELLKLFIDMDQRIINLFQKFISDPTNYNLLKIYLTNHKDINIKDIIDVLNKFKNKEIKAGKKKKKGKRILKKYKK
jgi:hypothetical protein